MNPLRNALRGLGPAVARPTPTEILRAAIGAGLGLLAAGFLARAVPHPGTGAVPFLIAPLGASAFLMFAVPNSPLSQPWSAVIGNLLSAFAGLVVIRLVPDPRLASALAVTLAMITMMVARAMHPPGGAVALLIALTATPGAPPGFDFAVAPVLIDTLILVALAVLFNRLTGRTYPFRQPPAASPHGTADAAPDRRLGLSANDLGQILQKMNLAANIGAEDLARLIGAAEAEATARQLGGLTAGDVMSQDVVTVPSNAHPDALARLFRDRRFKTLPVVAEDGTYLGLLSQSDLLARTDDRDEAEQIMSTSFATASRDTPLAPLLALLADGRQQAVPVLDGPRLVGLVTRSDMIGALAHALRK